MFLSSLSPWRHFSCWIVRLPIEALLHVNPHCSQDGCFQVSDFRKHININKINSFHLFFQQTVGTFVGLLVNLRVDVHSINVYNILNRFIFFCVVMLRDFYKLLIFVQQSQLDLCLILKWEIKSTLQILLTAALTEMTHRNWLSILTVRNLLHVIRNTGLLLPSWQVSVI